MLTVTQLAKKHGISRASLLYYEREGLLLPKTRTDNGYRWYGDNEEKRLVAILSYRSSGIPIAKILELLGHEQEQSQFHILNNHLHNLKNEIDILQQQQKATIAFLKEPELLEKNMVTPERWDDIMQAAGFDEKEMIIWHQQFEKMEPDKHLKFLELLGIDAAEIKKIRNF